MKIETVTQKFFSECPNCGAPRVANESSCRFCGSTLVEKTVVTEEMAKEPADRQYITDDSHPTIVSKLKPARLNDQINVFLLVAAGAFLAVSLRFLVFPPNSYSVFFSTGFAFLILAVMLVGAAVIPVLQYRSFLKSAPEYEATVVSVDKRQDLDPETKQYVEFTTMTVLFRYEGEEVFGVFRVSDRITPGTYAKGQMVRIRVSNGKIGLSEG